MRCGPALLAFPRRLLRGPAGLVLAAGLLAACGDGDDTGVRLPALEIRTTTTGTELDTDGYTVTVDGAPAQPIGLVDTVVVDPLDAGEHTVTLGGLAANCAPTGGATVTATVTGGATAVVEYDVVCGPTHGRIVVTTTSTGEPADTDGYAVQLDETTESRIGGNETKALEGVPPGQHQVTLTDLADNCTAADNPRTVTVTAGADSAVTFAVTCVPPIGTVHVSVTTSGAPVDPDGYLVSLDGAEPGVPIPATGTVDIPSVPVGSHTVTLGGLASNCMLQTQVSVTVAVQLADTADVSFAVSCLGDSQVIAFTANATGLLGVFVVSPDGSGRTNLTPDGVLEQNPVWSPDGRKLLVGRLDPSFLSETIYLMNADGSGRTPLADGELMLGYRWSPDGGRIAFSVGRFERDELRGDLWVMLADGSGKSKLASNAESPTWSPDGSRIAYVRDAGDLHIRIVNSAGGDDHRLSPQDMTAIQPAWSPDGSRIAFVSLGPNEIRVINEDGSGLLNLTNGIAQEDGPVWSPDGSRIAFNTGPKDEPLESEVAVMNPDGTGRVTLTNHPGFDLSPDWSPDGQRIVFVRSDQSDDIYVMNSDGSDVADVSNLPDAFESTPDWGGTQPPASVGPLAGLHRSSLRPDAMRQLRLERHLRLRGR